MCFEYCVFSVAVSGPHLVRRTQFFELLSDLFPSSCPRQFHDRVVIRRISHICGRWSYSNSEVRPRGQGPSERECFPDAGGKRSWGRKLTADVGFLYVILLQKRHRDLDSAKKPGRKGIEGFWMPAKSAWSLHQTDFATGKEVLLHGISLKPLEMLMLQTSACWPPARTTRV